MKSKLLVTTLIMFLSITTLMAQNSVLGKWKTIDDETGKAKSIVEIYQKNDKVYGKVVKLFREPNEDQDPTCTECDDDDPRKGKKIIGMEIIKELEKDDDEWNGGTILDPKNGEVYKCKIWIENKKLIVRGYIGFSLIGRSQTWLRVN